jgi:hypothetical protein
MVDDTYERFNLDMATALPASQTVLKYNQIKWSLTAVSVTRTQRRIYWPSDLAQ